MSLTEFIDGLEIPQRIVSEHPWCTKEWILFNVYFPISYPINPKENLDAWKKTEIGAVPVGFNYFCRATDSHGPGDLELWHTKTPAFFSEVNAEQIAEFRRNILEKERYRDAKLFAEPTMLQLQDADSYLPSTLIIPHPISVIIMERALRHKDFRLHW